MSEKYQQLAMAILKQVGGQENINHLIHCQTRLRFDLKDENRANVSKLKELTGVAGVINSGGQFQVVIGPHVSDVYEEVMNLLEGETNTEKVTPTKKKSMLSVAVEFISTAFSPIIPAMAGAGMIKALLALLVVFHFVSSESQTYYIVNFMADAVFYFLPFFLASTAARKLKCNPYLAMALAGILLHPNFASLVANGESVALFSMPVRLVSYGASVIPILLIVIVQSFIEKGLNKIIPNAVKIVFVPMLTIFVTGIIALVVIGPLGSYVGEVMALIFDAIRSVAPWAPAVIVGTLLPVMVMFGIHTSIAPLDVIQLTSVGYANIFGPGAMVSNIATGIATLVVGMKTTKQADKQVALSSGVTALMGITEPALYGVTLPKKYPLIASMIGGGLGGLYAGLSGASRFATGSSGLPAIPLYIGNDLSNVANILVAILITAVVTAITTFVFSLYFEKSDSTNPEKTTASIIEMPEIEIYSPINGKMIPLSEVEDDAFSTGMLGSGVAFEPKEGKVVAPFDGEVISLFPTKHAIGLRSDTGVELLIHVGLNTVELNGRYFDAQIEQGQRVSCGQLLLTFDLNKLHQEGYITQIPVVITNANAFKTVEQKENGTKHLEELMLTVKA